MPRRRRTSASFLASTLEAQVATWATLSMRVPALLSGTMSPAERTRMVAEKVEAVVESSAAVGTTATRLMRGKGRKVGPYNAFAAWLALADAGSRPFHKRVKANAVRLGKRRKSRSA